MTILYGVCAWGLGHATRSLPILRRLVADHEVLVYSDGAALAYLRRELGGRAAFLPATVPYPNIFGGTALAPRFFAFASSLRNVSGLTMSMNLEFVESYASK